MVETGNFKFRAQKYFSKMKSTSEYFEITPSNYFMIVEIFDVPFCFIVVVTQILFVTFYSFTCRNIQIALSYLRNQIYKASSPEGLQKSIAVHEKILREMSIFDKHFSFSAFLSVLLTMTIIFRSSYKLAFQKDLLQNLKLNMIASIIFYSSLQLTLMISASLTNEAVEETRYVLQESLKKYRICVFEKLALKDEMEDKKLTLWNICVVSRSLIISSIGTLLNYGILLGTLGK
ncbi:hypothetical protein AVEN_142575-1 [Araneus ventricosus]|uniref:Uncharacterized protein n=1 Tax=Araneus ventricosus TaxID=182803 RepID=A0A4Y2CG13_ARAVE|nr:hypothetical protein AVEN_142575-1 [Araneus ventricosus]